MIDREKFQPGYFKSTWPVECGGNRRQKSSKGRLNAENAVAEISDKLLSNPIIEKFSFEKL